ncbi:MAG: MFS transporter [Oscillospiraceae bacterium]|nr:MFS transporter [Oscillospiraceae bacterium]
MRLGTKRGKIFYGWWIAIACFFLSGGGVGILINSMGTFIKPVSEAMGFTRAQFSLSTSLSSFAGMFAYPVWGAYMKDHSIRKAMLVTGILIPVVLMGYSFCTQLWQFYLCSILIGLMTGSVSTLPITALINHWFEDARGTATGIGSCGSGLAMVIVPMVSAIITSQGWRMAYRALGIVFFLVIEGAAFFVLRDKPADLGLTPYRREENRAAELPPVWGLSRAEALRTASFRLFLVLGLLSGTVNTSIVNHTYACLTDIGITAARASAMISLQMLVLMLSKFSLGIVFDKAGLKTGFLLSVAGYALAGAFLFGAAYLQPLAYAALICSGVGSALPAMSMAYVARSVFGNKDYSGLCGVMLSLVFLGNTIGTTLNGYIYDVTGSYQLGWVLVVLEAAAMAVLFFLVLKTAKKLGLAPQQ